LEVAWVILLARMMAQVWAIVKVHASAMVLAQRLVYVLPVVLAQMLEMAAVRPWLLMLLSQLRRKS
jgi:hypothetical protein